MIKTSVDSQFFKIGRMSYSFPSFVVKRETRYYLSFNYGQHGNEWHAFYHSFPEYGEGDSILDCYSDKFNSALKQLHAKVKQVDKP